MPRLITLIFLCFPFALMAGTAKQNLSVCYYDPEDVKWNVPNPPNFIKGTSGPNVEKGVMLFYERKLFDVLTVLSTYIGADLGKWKMNGDKIYSTSCFLSGKMWILHLPFLHTYLEYSMFGPTALSKEVFGSLHFGSNFLFQNFFGIGVEVGEGSGFCVDLRIFRYTEKDFKKPAALFQVPITLSVGLLF